MSDEQAARITTVGQAVDFVLAHLPTASRGPEPCARCTTCWRAAGRPRPAGGHARLVDRAARGQLRAAGAPGRLGARPGGDDAPLPAAGRRDLRRRAADEDPRAGGLRPLVPRGGRAARAPGAAAGGGAADVAQPALEALVGTERVLASVIEAVIGACYLPTASRRPPRRCARRSRRRSSRRWSARPTSSRRCRSGWRAAARGVYEVTAEEGPPHERIFEVAAVVDGEERRARLRALEEGGRAGGGGRRRSRSRMEA